MEFLLTSLVVTLMPGSGVLFTVATGLSRGARAGVVAAAGCTLAILPHTLAAFTGLAALLHTSALAFEVLKCLGVVYLLWMALSTLRDKGALTVPDQDDGAGATGTQPAAAPRTALRVVVSAVLVNVLNPKVTLFFLAFLPQFVRDDDPHPMWRMAELSGVFMLVTFVVFVGYGTSAAAVRTHVVSRPRVLTWMRRLFAGAFVALGARLAFF
ncbi:MULTISPECIES: LysE family translocator [unclassified Streptomyces]|uniref:LysE family translocator n=1 Tax=unclassified Streptomyces TaxID=2593676 RepID=UPI002DD86D3B|nr:MULTISPECIES: LysE family translocator [unclassified Streptomyces]WSA96812.1 LysE family translocator [Streptomyces sp. NBC_01795]WSB81227.1 LysE family translocator [Streptomyces sp. NBC_01775]WSS10565.1 LysE family translocator [Streptomyces sp. NBC_01186]WSS39258.1 LysE family translocator [Streptomyces sp. NBC_01187]